MTPRKLIRSLRPRRDVRDVPVGSAPPRPIGPIVVGIDGSAAGARALEWATVRAYAGHTSLRIVHSVGIRFLVDPYGFTPGWPNPYWDIEARSTAEALLEAACDSARELAPLLQISSCVHRLDPAAAILAEGRSADVIVLGTTRWRSRPPWLGMDVAAQVARRARGRLVIVGPDDERLI